MILGGLHNHTHDVVIISISSGEGCWKMRVKYRVGRNMLNPPPSSVLAGCHMLLAALSTTHSVVCCSSIYHITLKFQWADTQYLATATSDSTLHIVKYSLTGLGCRIINATHGSGLVSSSCRLSFFCNLLSLFLLVGLLQVMLLGDSAVGKTCLLVRFKDGAFLGGNFIATVGIDFRVRVITFNSPEWLIMLFIISVPIKGLSFVSFSPVGIWKTT